MELAAGTEGAVQSDDAPLRAEVGCPDRQVESASHHEGPVAVATCDPIVTTLRRRGSQIGRGAPLSEPQTIGIKRVFEKVYKLALPDLLWQNVNQVGAGDYSLYASLFEIFDTNRYKQLDIKRAAWLSQGLALKMGVSLFDFVFLAELESCSDVD